MARFVFSEIPSFHFAAIGTFFHLPHAINAATSPSAKLKPITEISPLEIWNAAAKSIMRTRPEAANGVSCGLILSKEGNSKPSAPSASEMPINRTKISGICPAQGIVTASVAMGCVDFVAPAMRNIPANSTCATHKAILNPLLVVASIR